MFAQRNAKPREPFENVDEERTGATGGIEDSQSSDAIERYWVGVNFVGVDVDNSLCFGAREPVTLQRRGEGLECDSFDEVLRGEEHAATLSSAGFHERLKNLAQYLRIDRRLGPARCIFVRCEAISHEYVAKERSKNVVRESCVAVNPFDRCPREEPSIEKWHASEFSGASRAFGNASIESAKEQRIENPSLVTTAIGHAFRKSIREEAKIRVEPALGLEKGEK
jgi:hypothetical protein